MTRFFLRVVVWIGAVLVVSVCVVIAFMAGAHEAYLRPQIAEELRVLGAEFDDALAGASRADAARRLDEISERMLMQPELVPLDELGQAAADEPEFFIRPSGADFAVALRPDPERTRAFQRRQGASLAAAMLVIAAVIAISASFVVVPLVRRLRAQERTILAIAEGDFRARAPIGSRDALGKLGERINDMAARIESLLAQQRDLLHAVSHEMRTPAARIGFGLDLVAEAASPEERERRIASVHDDVNELDSLLGELLAYLRFSERPLQSAAPEQIDLVKVAEAAADHARPLRPDVRVDVISPDGPIGSVAGSERELTRAVENVIRNAVRHASSRVRVETAAGEDDGSVEMRVDDDGPGIAAADRERVFEPFVRLDRSRDRGSGGAGLGLAIARRILDRHRASIRIEDSPLSGARFVLRFSKE